MRQGVLLVFFFVLHQIASAQGIHFSQYYNAPQLLNPANTALMPDEDYRAGVNYREQWSNVPAAFKTFSVYGDFQALRNKNVTNWMGVGFGIFSDRAGTGILTLNKYQLALAYHVQMGENSMISAGFATAYVQRSIDFGKLTFDAQWDGFTFNKNNPQKEPHVVSKTGYLDLMAGVNYAYFPNPDFYLKIGFAAQHINRPNESFYKQENRLGIRPIGNVELVVRMSEKWIANPSIYYSYQKNATELIGGCFFNGNVGGDKVSQLILGGYYRWNESIIPVVGFEWSNVRFMTSYDATVSQFAQANRNFGAIEVSISFKGLYGSNAIGRGTYNCPRF